VRHDGESHLVPAKWHDVITIITIICVRDLDA
jgi:hypothetical protein